MKRRQVVILVVALGIIFGAFGLSNFLAKQKKPPKEKDVEIAIKYVRTQPINYQNIITKVIAYGRVQTGESLELIAEVPGRMVQGSVPLKEGTGFRKGQLICKIDDTEAKLNLQSEKSIFLKDLAAILPDFKIDFQKSFDVWQAYFNSIDLDKSLPDLPEYKSDQEKTYLATKNIFNSYYSIKSSETNLKKHQVYAPFGGSISHVYLQSGSYVNPGSKVARIVRTDKLELKVAVPAEDIPWIKENATVDITSQNGLQSWKGKVIRIGEVVNPDTQSLDVYIAIRHNQYKIFDGLYLKTEIPGKPVNESMEIPRNSVFDGSKVFLLEDTVLKVVDIKIHKINPETVIFSGLEEGQEIVVEPLINAYNNMRAARVSE